MINRKKIILLSPAHPLRGGIAALSERLAQELQHADNEVTIYSFSLQYPSWLFPGKTQYTDDPAPEGLNIRTLIHSINPINWWQMGALIHRQRPDVLLIRYWLPFMAPCLGTIARLAKKNCYTKVITIADNILPHERRPGDRLFTRYLVRASDAFVVMSRSVATDLQQFTNSKLVAYTPHPIYDNYGEPVEQEAAKAFLKLSQNTKYLLFFGFIRHYKGLDLLLQAMSDERIRQLNVKLLVAGEFYENAATYHQLIEDYHLRQQVILHTYFIPNERVKYYFGAADLVVQPYRSATQSGISQIAYHFEKPMVVTNVGGLPEIVAHGKSGYVVEVQASAIAEAIVDFFSHANRADELQAGVRAGKKQFDWSNMIQVISDLYKKLNND
ncbi:MAG TPA: glycosyltransferase [Saprospiraceae bacterium]|nr:glycosyltransferase [Saprospiraceae bacterium]HMP12480.1 glycosyltransferase [Saprospiraceae bacterium]